MKFSTQAIFHTAPKRVELQCLDLPPLGDDQVLIKAHYSAISPGTESMIFQHQFPDNEAQDISIESLQGSFKYPFRYGYSLVGETLQVGNAVSEQWLNKRVFAFHPHQNYAVVSQSDCYLIPDDISLQAAVLLPSMESALNFVMDAAPLAGENVMVMGQGVVGLLTTALLSKFPLSGLITSDFLEHRRDTSLKLGAMQVVNPLNQSSWQQLFEQFCGDLKHGMDLVIELSGNQQALNQAIEICGFDGRILVGSWYGNQGKIMNLGGHFHRRRLRIISSQVSTLKPELTGRWDKNRRINLAWDFIRQIQTEQFITHHFTTENCQQAFTLASSPDHEVLQIVFKYNEGVPTL